MAAGLVAFGRGGIYQELKKSLDLIDFVTKYKRIWSSWGEGRMDLQSLSRAPVRGSQTNTRKIPVLFVVVSGGLA